MGNSCRPREQFGGRSIEVVERAVEPPPARSRSLVAWASADSGRPGEPCAASTLTSRPSARSSGLGLEERRVGADARCARPPPPRLLVDDAKLSTRGRAVQQREGRQVGDRELGLEAVGRRRSVGGRLERDRVDRRR